MFGFYLRVRSPSVLTTEGGFKIFKSLYIMEIKVTKEINTLLLAIRALNHDIRLKMLNLLETHKGLTVNELAEKINLTQPETSHHLGILRRADLTRTDRQGKYIYYHPNKTSLKQLQNIAEYWEDNTTTESINQYIKRVKLKTAI